MVLFCSAGAEWCFRLVCVPRHRIAKYRTRRWLESCPEKTVLVQGLHYYYYYYSLATVCLSVCLSLLTILQQDSPQFGRSTVAPFARTVDVKFC